MAVTEITPINNATLTTAAVDGTGIFDVLMRATKVHLDEEYAKNRLRGPEYATVYLGSLQEILKASMDFVLTKQKSQREAELLNEQIKNAIAENAVLVAQKCKLDAEFDVLVQTKLKTIQETTLLTWKVNTEKAQTLALGVDDNSVIGKQKILYTAQSDGFKRDAEQKAAKVLVDTWNVRRTTAEATVADATNKLYDTSIGRVIDKLITGVGA